MTENLLDIDCVFHALGDATRRAMMERLSAGPRSVSYLADPFAMRLAQW
jgi:DNA-binding transcriptional ArsR family regulator